MKKFLKLSTIIILLLGYAYFCNINMIPNQVILLQGEEIHYWTMWGLSVEKGNQQQTKSVVSQMEDEHHEQNYLKLLGKIPIKTINVNTIPKTMVVPIGKTIGMKLYTNGVLVVGMTEINQNTSNAIKPYENTEIEEGDRIISVNEKMIHNTNELIEAINESEGNEIKIKYMKEKEEKETTIYPALSGEEYKIGLWVRDAAAGVGTLTFYEPSTYMFMALGHGIEDIDTGKIVEISNGELVTANIISIVKGEKDHPGEIRGTITNGTVIGKIDKNTSLGVYGNIQNKDVLTANTNDAIEVGNRKEIREGKATILCQLDNNAPKEYEIEIEKIYLQNDQNNKSMLIKITDQELLEKTGGIIQGMSGAPVLQNGKLIGAVTNVLVKDPTKGYAIFGDLLIKQMKSVQ